MRRDSGLIQCKLKESDRKHEWSWNSLASKSAVQNFISFQQQPRDMALWRWSIIIIRSYGTIEIDKTGIDKTGSQADFGNQRYQFRKYLPKGNRTGNSNSGFR